ncbi:MAG: HPr family phosphocarrier protein [Syntrophothermus sp.]
MKSAQFDVMDPVGLHARPAALFVKLASKFSSNITISNLSTEGKKANAKSILGLLTCGVKQGDRVEVQAEGADEEQAVAALEKLVTSNFTEGVE